MKTEYRIELGVNQVFGKVWQTTETGDETLMRERFAIIKSKGWKDYRLVKLEILEES